MYYKIMAEKYVCQCCGEEFISKEECIKHEAGELNLSIEEYHELCNLLMQERRAFCTDKETPVVVMRQNRCAEQVMEFCKAHNLSEHINLEILN